MVNALDSVLLAGFDILKFFENTKNYATKIGGAVVGLIGVILIIVAVVQVAKGLAGGGKGQVNWVMSIATLLVGGVLLAGGWKFVTSTAEIGKDTLSTLGGANDDGTANNGNGWTGGAAAPAAPAGGDSAG